MTTTPPIAHRMATRIARIVVLAFPPRFRERVGADMIDSFARYCGAARRRGRIAYARAILRASAEALFQGAMDRWDRRTDGRRSSLDPAEFFIADNGSGFMSSLVRDLRFGLRSLRRSPGFAVTVVVVLALGIGATTAMFAVVDALALRGLPFDRSEELVRVSETYQPEDGPLERRGVSYPTYRDWVDATSAFAHLAIVDGESVTLNRPGRAPGQLPAEFVSPSYFAVLGTIPAAGRLLQDPDDRVGSPVAVLSHAVWRSWFGGDPSVIGRTIDVNGMSVPLVGVAQPGFRGAFDDTDIWLPVRAEGELVPSEPASQLERRGSRGYFVMGRLRSDATVAMAQREIDVVIARLHESGEQPLDRAAMVTSFEEAYLGDARHTAGLLLGAVGFVLLIACTNVANLMLARQVGRARQIAIERALGASRAAVVRRQLAEGALLAALGGGTGFVLAVVLTDALVADGLSGVPSYIRPDVSLVGAAFTVAVSLAVAVAVGIVPAVIGSRTPGTAAVRGSGRSETALPGGRIPWRSWFVAGQVAIAVSLVIGAGLVFRSVRGQLAIDPGFEPDQVVAARLNLPEPSYPDAASWSSFADRLQRELDAAPGITHASIASDVPLMGGSSAIMVGIDGDPGFAEEQIRVYWHRVSPNYFATLGIPIVRGRPIDATDVMGGTRAIVVSRRFANRVWPDDDPIGRRVSGAVVVGVAGHVRFRALVSRAGATPDDPDIFMPLMQVPTNELSVLARAQGDTDGAHQQIRQAVRRLDQSVPVFLPTTLNERVKTQVASANALSRQLGTFAGLAIVLAIAGLYGVMAYSVGRRTNEIGLRMALGANERRVLRMVLAQGAGMVGVGLLIGVVGGSLMSRTLSDQLYGVSILDPTTYGVVAILFLAVGLVAALVPAHRAARISPLEALRDG